MLFLGRRKFYKIVSEDYQEYIQKNYRMLLKEQGVFDDVDMEWLLFNIIDAEYPNLKTWNINYLCGTDSNPGYLKQCIDRLKNFQFV